ITVSFDAISSGYPADQLSALAHRLVASAGAVPGVTSAAASACGLLAGCSSSGSFRIEGAGDDPKPLYRNWVTPGYFQNAGIRVVAGREFSERDTASAPQVAVVNETVVRRYFPGQSAVGKHVASSLEIVGVVRDARTQSLHDEPVPMIYVPADQAFAFQQRMLTNLDVRAAGAPAAVEQQLRAAIRASEPNL